MVLVAQLLEFQEAAGKRRGSVGTLGFGQVSRSRLRELLAALIAPIPSTRNPAYARGAATQSRTAWCIGHFFNVARVTPGISDNRTGASSLH
jgi:hypothetical protein